MIVYRNWFSKMGIELFVRFVRLIKICHGLFTVFSRPYYILKLMVLFDYNFYVSY